MSFLDPTPTGADGLHPTGIPGLHLRDGSFEETVAAVQGAIDELIEDQGATALGVPPLISRADLERLGYVESFPHLLGVVYTYGGDERQWRRLIPQVHAGGPGWTAHHTPSDVVVLPAVCYHVYPRLAGTSLAAPLSVDAAGTCYRHESTDETGRLRSFRMRELIRVDTPEATASWQNAWVETVRAWLAALDLDVDVEAANDPFFGVAGERLSGPAQRAEQLKWELTVPVADGLRQAVASCNRHKDHFSATLGFSFDGAPAHTACTAFGLERIALAVRHRHGPDPAQWPDGLRAARPGARPLLL